MYSRKNYGLTHSTAESAIAMMRISQQSPRVVVNKLWVRMILHNSESRAVFAGKDPVGIMEYYPNLRSVHSGHTSEAIVHSCFGFLATSHPPLHGSGFHHRPAPTAAATIGLTPRQRPGSSNPTSHLVVMSSSLGAQPATAYLLNYLACGTLRRRLGRGRPWRIRRLFLP